MKIKKGDNALVISGKDRARTGKIIKILPKEGRAVIEGINLIKKHVRSKKQGQKGQVVQMPAPLPLSKIKILCPKCGKASKVGFSMVKGEKQRICKKCLNSL